MNNSIKPRRKPMQSRAWMTSNAIQDAFVLGMVEHGYERVSMREIAGVAGVGLGTLYLYFPNKQSIAAVTIRSWLQTLARTIGQAGMNRSVSTLRAKSDAMVRAQIQSTYAKAESWRALMFLERRLSTPAAYRETYNIFVMTLAKAYAEAEDWPANRDPLLIGFLAWATINGMVRDSMMLLTSLPPQDFLIRTVQNAAWSSVRDALEAPINYRVHFQT